MSVFGTVEHLLLSQAVSALYNNNKLLWLDSINSMTHTWLCMNGARVG